MTVPAPLAAPVPAPVRLPSRLRTTTRLVVALVLIASVAASAVSLVTFITVRSYLAAQRTDLAFNQAFSNAQVVQDYLSVGADASLALTATVRQPGSAHLVDANGVWFSQGPVVPEQVPGSLLAVAVDAGAATQFASAGDVPYLWVAFALDRGAYVEAVPLSDLDATLTRLLWTLVLASLAASGFALAAGVYAARRLLRPLNEISRSARSIEAGDLQSRLEVTGDGDLDPIVRNFNRMADALEARIERERRFSSDVSHELRSPLTAMHTSVDVLKSRSGDLPGELAPVVELIDGQVARMETMVVDLLEISRLGAAADPQLCPVPLRDLVAGLCLEHRFDSSVNRVPDGLVVSSDPRYLARVLSNLMVNARVHGKGLVSVSAWCPSDGSACEVEVTDAGAGLTPAQFAALSEPFARAKEASSRPGSGLGLSIVRLYAGRLGVRLRPERLDAGSAMVLTVPLWDAAAEPSSGCASQ